MMLSEDKILHMSHIIFKGLVERKLINPVAEESKVRAEIKRAIIAELKIGEEIDFTVRKRLQSFSKKIFEGSPEWEIMYKKYFREEEVKRGRTSG
jgi:hypothetical protein